MSNAAGHKRKTEKLLIIVVLSLMMSVLLSALFSLLLDGQLTLKPLAIAAACALLIATPIGHFVLSQTEKLEAAHAELTAAHRQLSELYRQLENAHHEMEFKARHDAMTGLVNRAAFRAALEARRRGSDQGFMLMIDADRFKRVNDTYGHDTGDRVLVSIARVLRSVTRSGDICARIGGEEFAVYLPGANHGDAFECAERLRAGVAAEHIEMSTGALIGITVSIGAAPFEAGQSVDDVMRAADQLLYQAKSAGRNRTCIADQLPQAA